MQGLFSVRFPLVAVSLCIAAAGCGVLQSPQLSTLKTRNRALIEQNRAQLAEIENLKIHTRNTEDQLMRTEEELALMEEQLELHQRQVANYEDERETLHNRFLNVVNSRDSVSPAIAGQLAELSAQYDGLDFDPKTGVAKLETDIVFDSGEAELKQGARQVLAEMARVLKSAGGKRAKLLVAGHTDAKPMAKRPARDIYPNNFHLSTARALAVADELQKLGVEKDRIGVAGFGAHQPIAPNTSARDRRKNRRVEIFVMAPEVPVVGWTETMPSVY